MPHGSSPSRCVDSLRAINPSLATYKPRTETHTPNFPQGPVLVSGTNEVKWEGQAGRAMEYDPVKKKYVVRMMDNKKSHLNLKKAHGGLFAMIVASPPGSPPTAVDSSSDDRSCAGRVGVSTPGEGAR